MNKFYFRLKPVIFVTTYMLVKTHFFIMKKYGNFTSNIFRLSLIVLFYDAQTQNAIEHVKNIRTDCNTLCKMHR